MSFKTVGNIDVTVKDAFIAQAHWTPKPGEVNSSGIPVVAYCDIVLLLEDRDGNNDFWRGEISNRSGAGTRAHQEQTDITLEKLQAIGFSVRTFQELLNQIAENSSIPGLIGLKCTVTTEEREFEGRDGNTRKAISVKYLSPLGGAGPKRMSLDEIRAIFGAQIPVMPQNDPPQNDPQIYPQGYPQGYQQGYQQGYPQNDPQGYRQAPPQGYRNPYPAPAGPTPQSGQAPQTNPAGKTANCPY